MKSHFEVRKCEKYYFTFVGRNKVYFVDKCGHIMILRREYTGKIAYQIYEPAIHRYLLRV